MERVCLCWAALGKTSKDIGLILCRPSDSVNYYVKRARGKLTAASRCQAAVLAVRRGLIDPDRPDALDPDTA